MTLRRWLAASVLVLLNVVTLYFVGISWAVTPDGPWDKDTLTGLSAGAFFGAALALPTLLLTIIPVRLHWLRPWWFAVPALLLVLGVARLVHLDTAYPELPDGYGLPSP